ncbi:ribosomal protein, L4/L1 family [Treponema primitia ZAS-2]|uniref:Large ribosomal subunit protein uL4 n=1 Tax=Treponema primitia (strain ATCC BAA-887 / DSM 12427 / ZAS-2) TaxID=545694 RepID=F5YQ24_TREPZ|nr:50S ribosomal protein L4 [Treponema primitia]AEF86413.1 ribosomal protein, L4/L1 family [Treponema primitia ZAS-2]
MNRKVYSKDGKELRDIELDDAVFGLPVNEDLIWYAINNELANKRLGTASTKDRGEVHGSNAKPYKQKGTGRARRGDKKSPIMVGGGVVFGPRPRDFSYAIPKKAKRLALKTILSLKAQSDTLKVVEDFSIDSGKTKELAGLLKNFGGHERTVVILKDDDPELRQVGAKLRQAGANIPWLSFLAYNRLRAHDLFYGRKVIVLESAAKSLCSFYTSDETPGEAAE